MNTPTITEFLLARIAEDEAVARAATPGPWERPLNTRYKASVTAEMPKGDPASRWKGNVDHKGDPERVGVVSCQIWSDGKFFRRQSGRDLEHIARHDPSRVLGECRAKRQMIELYEAFGRSPEQGAPIGWTALGAALHLAAAVYADHPDYDPEWAL